MGDSPYTPGVPVGIDGKPIDTPRSATTESRVSFHVIGMSLMACTFVAVSFVASLITWMSSTCDGFGPSPDLVTRYQIALVVLLLLGSLAPAAWTMAARLSGNAWKPWAIFSIVVLVVGVRASVGIEQVEYCLF